VDYRVRRRAVQARLAPPGRYLSLTGGEEGLLVTLEDEVTRIGRGLGANLRLDDERVSRRHAIIEWRAGRARLLDDRSSNGTYVNGRQVVEAELHDGDVIHIGPVAFRYLELRAEHPQGEKGTSAAGPRASESPVAPFGDRLAAARGRAHGAARRRGSRALARKP